MRYDTPFTRKRNIMPERIADEAILRAVDDGFARQVAFLADLVRFASLRSLGYQPAAKIYLQSVVEEECTGNGALACLQRGYHADAAFIPEPLEPRLMRAQVGPIWFRVEVDGDPQHASGAFSAGANAIE